MTILPVSEVQLLFQAAWQNSTVLQITDSWAISRQTTNIQNSYICNSNEIQSSCYKFPSLCSKDGISLLVFWTLAASCACENDDFRFEKNGYFNCCRNTCFLRQKITNNTPGMVSRQCWNLQVVSSRLSQVWLYNLNVHKLTNAILTWTFEHVFLLS